MQVAVQMTIFELIQAAGLVFIMGGLYVTFMYMKNNMVTKDQLKNSLLEQEIHFARLFVRREDCQHCNRTIFLPERRLEVVDRVGQQERRGQDGRDFDSDGPA